MPLFVALPVLTTVTVCCPHRIPRNLRDYEPSRGLGTVAELTPNTVAVGEGTCKVQLDCGMGSGFELNTRRSNPFWNARPTSTVFKTCSQVVVPNRPPVANIRGDRFTPNPPINGTDPSGSPGCWVHAQTDYQGFALESRPQGSPAVGKPSSLEWIVSGRSCSAAEAFEFLGPCPSPSCVSGKPYPVEHGYPVLPPSLLFIQPHLSRSTTSCTYSPSALWFCGACYTHVLVPVCSHCG